MTLTRQQTDQFVQAVYAMPGLDGVPIGMYESDRSTVIAQGVDESRASGVHAIIIEQSLLAGSTLDRRGGALIAPYDARPSISAAPVRPRPPTRAVETHRAAEATEALRTNRSRLVPELLGAGLSCTFAIVSAAGVAGGTAATPVTAGTSTLVTVAAWTGLVTGAAQCLNGIYRVHEIATDPTGTSLDQLDGRRWYQVTSFIVDAVGVVSGIPSLLTATRSLTRALQLRHGLPTDSALRAMNHAGRRRAVSEAIERASVDSEVRRLLLEASAEARRGASTGSRIGARASIRAVDEHLVRAVNAAMRDAIIGYGQITVNALPGDWVGSASGSINTTGSYIIHLIMPD